MTPSANRRCSLSPLVQPEISNLSNLLSFYLFFQPFFLKHRHIFNIEKTPVADIGRTVVQKHTDLFDRTKSGLTVRQVEEEPL